MKKLLPMLVVLVTTIFSAVSYSVADNNCNTWSEPNVPWNSYLAGSMNVDTRSCSNQGFSRVDVRNPYSYPICITVFCDTTGKKYVYGPTAPGTFHSTFVNVTGAQWQIGAKLTKANNCPDQWGGN